MKRELTQPTDREYISGVVKWGVSAPGAGIRDAPRKANSYHLLRFPYGFPSSALLIPGCIAAASAEVAGRTLFYAMYSRLGV